VSEKKIQLDESAIMTIFLSGLPKEYAIRVDAIESMGETNRDVILMRLQEKELDANQRTGLRYDCKELVLLSAGEITHAWEESTKFQIYFCN
jgi:hypothetical protein